MRPKLHRARGTQVYEDVPLEMFADRLPAWPGPIGDTMSYSRDRSAGSRGVGAVASRDLRDGGGGAVVRTVTGSVVLTKSPEHRRSRWDPLGASVGPTKPKALSKIASMPTVASFVRDIPKPRKPPALVRPLLTTDPKSRPLVRTVVPTNKLIILTAGGPLSPTVVVPSTSGSGVATPFKVPQIKTAIYGGSSSPTASGGGISTKGAVTSGGGSVAALPSYADEDEVDAAAAEAAPAKKTISTAVKVTAALGVAGWLLYSYLGKGH